MTAGRRRALAGRARLFPQKGWLGGQARSNVACGARDPHRGADIVFMSPEGWPTLADEIERQAQQEFMSLEASLKGVPHRLLTLKGKILEVLGEIVTGSEIDLVVLGTHGRTGIRKLAIGSIAEEIFRRARCPVLSVGPHVSHKLDRGAEFHHILFATDFSP